MLTATAAPARCRPDAGLSLVEVMVAMGVFVIGSLSLLTVLTSSNGGTFDNRARLTAANLAASDIDEARSKSYYDLAVGTSSRTVEVDQREYTVVREVAVTMAGGTAGTSSCVASGSSRQLHKRVSTSVTTDFRGGTAPIRADTIVKAPVFDPNSPNGAIGFLVMDRNGNPQSGLQVAVPGLTRTTDANGCSFFDGLTPQTYTVTVTKAGAVTRQGSSTLSKSVVVNPGQITSDSIRIGTGIPVTVKAKAFTGADPAPPPTYSCCWRMPTALLRLTSPDRWTPTAVQHREGKTMTGADLGWTAFPSPGGYDAHIGACSVMHHFDSEPSTSPVFDLPFSPVSFHLRGATAKTSGKTLRATWVSSPTCDEVLRWTETTSSTCTGDSNGTSACRLDLALPQGQWRIRVIETNGTIVSGMETKTITVGLRASVQLVEVKEG